MELKTVLLFKITSVVLFGKIRVFIRLSKVLNLRYKREYLTHLNKTELHEYIKNEFFGFGATKSPAQCVGLFYVFGLWY
jgi:hypothetical protein